MSLLTPALRVFNSLLSHSPSFNSLLSSVFMFPSSLVFVFPSSLVFVFPSFLVFMFPSFCDPEFCVPEFLCFPPCIIIITCILYLATVFSYFVFHIVCPEFWDTKLGSETRDHQTDLKVHSMPPGTTGTHNDSREPSVNGAPHLQCCAVS